MRVSARVYVCERLRAHTHVHVCACECLCTHVYMYIMVVKYARDKSCTLAISHTLSLCRRHVHLFCADSIRTPPLTHKKLCNFAP